MDILFYISFYILIIIFINLNTNPPKATNFVFSIFFFIGISNQVISIFNKTENVDLEALQNATPFYPILNEGLDNKYSIVVLVYDGYPQNETLKHYGIDNSDQTNFLINNGFVIFNGTYSIGSYSLGTMARLFEGTNVKINEENSRNITGGYSSLLKH